MKNFLRAMRFAWPYRRRIAVSLICALLAAGFWGLNFLAIYPASKIIGSKQNLQFLIDKSIKEAGDKLDPLRQKGEKLTRDRKQLEQIQPGKDRDEEQMKIDRELARNESKLQALSHELYYNQLAKKYIIDRFFPDDAFQTLIFLICLVVCGIALKGVFDFWQETLVGSVVNLSLYDLRNRFYRKAIHLDVRHFTEQGTHEMMARFTNDMELLGAGQKMLFGKMVAEPLRAIVCMLIACWINWQLTLLFLVLVPVSLVILTRVGKLMKRATRRLLERMSYIYKILHETFQGIRVVKAFTREPGERRRMRKATRDYYHKSMRVVILDAVAGPIIELLGVAAVAGALLCGAYLVLTGETKIWGFTMTEYPLETEVLIALYTQLLAIADPVRKLSSFLTKVQSGAAGADRIFSLMDQEPRVQANHDSPRLPAHHEVIEFKNVCFSYEPGRPILTGIDLQVGFGETIALVGKNGCGKSTLVGLLPRFYDPDHGCITVDGCNIRNVNLRSLRQQIGIVTQEPILFDDTVFNNIAYGRPRATKDEVETAAQQAFVHEVILKLPKGYDTMIGEAGGKLSGGQKQRLTLARAILRNPRILILDEFTSQSDAESEAIIHRVLREFMRHRTAFVITHRLNTLEIADRIVVLDAGRVIAVGGHGDLLKSCDVYQRLHEAHFQRLVA